MRRKSFSGTGVEPNLNRLTEIDFKPLPTGKTLHRKCECCGKQKEHDYLRQQRESREKRLIHRKESAKDLTKNNKTFQEISVRTENEDPNISLEKIQEIQNQIFKSIHESSQIVKNESQQGEILKEFIEQLIPSSPRASPKTPLELTPEPMKKIVIKNHLSSILQAQNSESMIASFQRISLEGVKLSLSVHLQDSEFYQQWNSRQEALAALELISKILTNQ